MSISLDYLKIFFIVAKYGKIATASEKLYISQPAVTQTIKKLEDELGSVLFVRTKKGMELTYEGRGLYNYIKDSMEVILNSEDFFSNYNNLEHGKVKIGGGRSFLDLFIMPLCEKYMEMYPTIDISLLNVPRAERINKVLNGDLNITIAEDIDEDFNEKYANLEAIKLYEDDQYMFIANPKFLKEHNIKNFEDIKDVPLIVPDSSILRDILDKELKKCDVKFSCKYDVYSARRFYKMIDECKGIGFTNNIYQEFQNKNEEKKYTALKKIKNVKTCEYVITLKKDLRSKATNEFLKLIKEKIKMGY